MPRKPKADGAPKFFLTSGEAALAYRKQLALNQSAFWGRIGVRQSGGSRYESGRKLPRPVQMLLHFAYAPEAQAQAMLSHLRNPAAQDAPHAAV
ncbi:MAG: helix-turn-helix transcriptional regulator [Rhodocyclaceae bacterium]